MLKSNDVFATIGNNPAKHVVSVYESVSFKNNSKENICLQKLHL